MAPHVAFAANHVCRWRAPLYHPDFPVVLFWSERAGCTSLVKWFFFHTGLLEEALSFSSWVHDFEGQYKNREGYQEEVRRVLTKGRKPALKLVRDPFRRAISSFLTLAFPVAKNYAKPHFTHELWRRLRAFHYGDPKSDRGVSFRQYLEFLEFIGVRVGDVNTHLAQQYISLEERFIGDLLRLESLEADLRRLEAQYGLAAAPETLLKSDHHIAYGDSSANAADLEIREAFLPSPNAPPWIAFYDRHTAASVARLYASDFAAYGYDADAMNPTLQQAAEHT